MAENGSQQAEKIMNVHATSINDLSITMNNSNSSASASTSTANVGSRNRPGPSASSANIINNTFSGCNIENVVQTANLTARTSSNSNKVDINYCPTPVRTFIGRYEELGTLKTLFTEHQVVALVGLGGLGKTQLSRKYVQLNKDYYVYKYWLESETPEKLENSFKNIADKWDLRFNNIDELVNDVYRKIDAVRTILIFDNVENPKDVYAYLPTRVDLPPGVTIHVLITSRLTDWTCDEQIKCHKLQPLNVSESLQILQRKFDEIDENDAQDKWEELAEKLGYLPYALQVAAIDIHTRYQHSPDLDKVLADYIKQVRDGAENILKFELPEYDNGPIYKPTILPAKQLNDNVWECAVTLMNTAAYMYPDYIDKEFLLGLLDYNKDDKMRILDEALIFLTKYSLFNHGASGQNFYTIHRILQISIRHNQREADMYYTGALRYLHADDYMFARDVLQYAHNRASAVVEFYKKNPSSSLIQYLILCNFIKAVKHVLLRMPRNQIDLLMHQHDLLYFAASSGYLGMTQLLFRNNVAVTNQLRRVVAETPFQCAYWRGNMDIAKLLFQNESTPTVQGYSVNEEHLSSIIKFLVENDATIAIVDNEENTVLHSAARGARAVAVSLILEKHKVLINKVNTKGQTALHVLGKSFIHRMKYLPEKDRKYLFDGFKQTARVLIMHGLSLDTRDRMERTPLNTVSPEFKDILQQVADECNNQSMVRPVKRQGVTIYFLLLVFLFCSILCILLSFIYAHVHLV